MLVLRASKYVNANASAPEFPREVSDIYVHPTRIFAA
jgi:hypothetical protein